MPGDKFATCHDPYAVCGDAERDDLACPFGRNAVAVAAYRYEASAGNAQGQLDAGIKRHADRLQHRLFQREDLGDRGIMSWMAARPVPGSAWQARRSALQSLRSVAWA